MLIKWGGENEPPVCDYIENHLLRIRILLSKLYAHRWAQAVKNTQDIRKDAAILIAEYRGSSTDVFEWLIDQGQIAFYERPVKSKDGSTFESLDIATPVINPEQFDAGFDEVGHAKEWIDTEEGKAWAKTDQSREQINEELSIIEGRYIMASYIDQKGWAKRYPDGGMPDWYTYAHGRCRSAESEAYKGVKDWYWVEHVPCRRTDEFLSMHCKWGWQPGSEKSNWVSSPKGRGMQPWIVGDLAKAEVVIIGESTWDPVAFVDCFDLYREPEPFAFIATRSANNASKIPVDKINPDAVILLLLQNDEANEIWHSELPLEIQKRGRRVNPPP